MAVCAGITYSSNVISVIYNAADGAKGASFSNPYTLADIYDTALSAGWGVVSGNITLGDFNQYLLTAKLYCSGGSTFLDLSRTLITIYDPLREQSYEVLRITCNLLMDLTTIAFGYAVGANLYQRGYFDQITNGVSMQISNSIFPLANSLTFYGGLSLENCVFKYISNFYFTGSTVSSPSIDNITVSNGAYGIIPRCPLLLANNITVKNCTRGVLAGYGDFTLRGYKVQNCSYDIALVPDSIGRVDYFVDCYIDPSKVALVNLGGNRSINAYLQTTFNTFVENSNGGLLRVKDKEGAIIYSENMTTDESTTQELTFSTLSYVVVGGVATYTRVDNYPLTVEISKIGYEPLIIPGITITPGVPTMIRGSMVVIEPTPPSINSLQIINPGVTDDDGIIVITAANGTQPYEYSLNGGEYQASSTFENLSEGTYTIIVKDTNDNTDSISGVELKKTDFYEQLIEVDVEATENITSTVEDSIEIDVEITIDEITV